jgi:hypothetical protein
VASLRRLAAGALLLAEQETERKIHEAAKQRIATASLEAKRDRQRTALLLLLLSTGKSMAGSLVPAIVAGRQSARQAGIRRLNAELRTAGVDAIHTVRPMLAARALARSQIDQVRAQLAAESLATQWRGLATRLVYRDEGLAKTLEQMRPAIARVATSEAAEAYNDEHHAALQDAVRYGVLDAEDLVREWSAEIDSCEHCWPLDGVQVGINDEFPGGEEPGSVHPRCRCTEILVSADQAQRRAA